MFQQFLRFNKKCIIFWRNCNTNCTINYYIFHNYYIFLFVDNNISLCEFVFNRYLASLEVVLKSPKGLEELTKFTDLLKYTSYYTKSGITSFIDLYNLYRTLEAQLATGFSLPEWTRSIYPYGKLTTAMTTFFALLDDDLLTPLNSGMFIQKMYFTILFMLSWPNY